MVLSSDDLLIVNHLQVEISTMILYTTIILNDSKTSLINMQRVLSIQSHVTHGFVGNKAATFPLQCLGWDVDVLNTVNFLNHTGYGTVSGLVMTPEEVSLVFAELEKLSLVDYECLLTGYVPNSQLLNTILALGQKLKKNKNSPPLWLLDPVMGDEGVLYVDKSVVAVYRDAIHSGAVDIITPNQYELELLLGFEINTEESVQRAMHYLHDKCHIKYVIITSIYLNGNKEQLLSVCSSAGSLYSIIEIKPVIEGYFTGVGDLFSALILDRIYKKGPEKSLENCVRDVMGIMNKVLRVTNSTGDQNTFGGNSISVGGNSSAVREKLERKSSTPGGDSSLINTPPAINTPQMRLRELRVVECARFFT